MCDRSPEKKWYLEDPRTAKRALVAHSEDKPTKPAESQDGFVYLIIDCSSSMAGGKLKQAKKGALNFARDALAKGYLTGLIQFHTSASLISVPQAEASVLEQSLDKMELGSLTFMAEGIRLAHVQLKNKPGTKFIVIVTDGVPNGPGDPASTLTAKAAADKDGIHIIAIGTDDADQAFLEKLATRTDLGIKVSKEHLERTIASSVSMLPTVFEPKSDK